MARVTVEDCVTIVPNRFELVLLTSQRARDISSGLPLTVDRDNDKNPVIALREVVEQSIDFQELRRHIVHGVNRHAELNNEDDAILAVEGFENMPTQGDSAEEIREVAFEDESESMEEPAETEPTEDEAEELAARAEMQEISEDESSVPLDQEIIDENNETHI